MQSRPAGVAYSHLPAHVMWAARISRHNTHEGGRESCTCSLSKRWEDQQDKDSPSLSLGIPHATTRLWISCLLPGWQVAAIAAMSSFALNVHKRSDISYSEHGTLYLYSNPFDYIPTSMTAVVGFACLHQLLHRHRPAGMLLRTSAAVGVADLQKRLQHRR